MDTTARPSRRVKQRAGPRSHWMEWRPISRARQYTTVHACAPRPGPALGERWWSEVGRGKNLTVERRSGRAKGQAGAHRPHSNAGGSPVHPSWRPQKHWSRRRRGRGAWRRDKRGREDERTSERWRESGCRGVDSGSPPGRKPMSRGGRCSSITSPVDDSRPAALDPAVVMFPVYRTRRQCAVCCGYVSSLGPSGTLEGGELSSRPWPRAGRCTKARRGSAQSVAVSGYLSGGAQDTL
ncbi:hypothetical protein EDB80DRAFT_288198 [Ilyonectria destructans]|nr:hypothetical protein EDB80DRAFT_288198 [Ilyonectria destructans]